MEKAVDEFSTLPPSFQADLLKGKRPDASLAHLIPYWSSMSTSGVRGAATKGSIETGEKYLTIIKKSKGVQSLLWRALRKVKESKACFGVH